MAPGLVDVQQTETFDFNKDTFVGPKETFIGGPKTFNKAAEEKGTKSQPPASHPNYLPV